MHSDRTSTRMRCGRTPPCAREPMGTEPSIKQANLLFGPARMRAQLCAAERGFAPSHVREGNLWLTAQVSIRGPTHVTKSRLATERFVTTLSIRAGGPTSRKRLRADRPTHTPCFRLPPDSDSTAARPIPIRTHAMLALAIPASLCDGRRYAAFDLRSAGGPVMRATWSVSKKRLRQPSNLRG